MAARDTQYVRLPEMMLTRADFEYIQQAIIERRSTWGTFVQEALIEAAHR